MIVLTSFVIERGFFYLYKMKYIIVLLLSSCSYSIHEHNLTQQRQTMLKYDKHSRKVQQKMRSEKQVKKKVVKVYKKRLFIK